LGPSFLLPHSQAAITTEVSKSFAKVTCFGLSLNKSTAFGIWPVLLWFLAKVFKVVENCSLNSSSLS